MVHCQRKRSGQGSRVTFRTGALTDEDVEEAGAQHGPVQPAVVVQLLLVQRRSLAPLSPLGPLQPECREMNRDDCGAPVARETSWVPRGSHTIGHAQLEIDFATGMEVS